MPFLTVIPSLRTPFGVNGFDYAVDDASNVHIGDILRVPFRRHLVVGAVCRIGSDSPFAKQAIRLVDVSPLARLGAAFIEILLQTAEHTFSSQPTILAAWLRGIPKRPQSLIADMTSRTEQETQVKTILTAHRLQAIRDGYAHATGRTLILTPWQRRADTLGHTLACPVLHADVATAAAWKTWNAFLHDPHGTLVATRLGAWLSVFADTLLMDEPENDDYKQDELSPRIDARWIVGRAIRLRTPAICHYIGTTPLLQSYSQPAQDIPSLEPELVCEPWQKGSSSGIAGLTGLASDALCAAQDEKRPIIILHPIAGERSRVTCRDCGWSATCPRCGFGVSKEAHRIQCRRCGYRGDAPFICPTCGGSDLNKSRIGKLRLAENIIKAFPHADVRIVDLPEWNGLLLPPRAFVLVTDLSLIGGVSEDIRRRERLIIAWRRLAASIQNGDGRLFIQGPDDVLTQARTWLSSIGVQEAWRMESAERATFGYPPAHKRYKFLTNGTPQEHDHTQERLGEILGKNWTIEGPYAVPFRSVTRKPRCVFHLLPPNHMTETEAQTALNPLANSGIIDLDPIAFFS